MPRPALLPLLRHPVAVALRLVLWPLAILGLSDLASRSANDALAGGLTAFAVIAGLAFALPLLDGLVLRTRALVLVWSVTTLVVATWLVSPRLIAAFARDPDAATWDHAQQTTLDDLPLSAVFFLLLGGVPVAFGAVSGWALRRSTRPLSRTSGLPVPRR